MLTKKLLLALILGGALVTLLFDEPNLNIALLHKLGIVAFVAGFLMVPFYHLIQARKAKKSSPLSTVLVTVGLLLLVLAVVTFFMESGGSVCDKVYFGCLGWFFKITLPSVILGLLLLFVSIFTRK